MLPNVSPYSFPFKHIFKISIISDFHPPQTKMRTERLFLGDINVIAKCRIEEKMYSRKSELQEFVLAAMKDAFGVMCFSPSDSGPTIVEYNNVHATQHVEQKIKKITEAINEFQTPKQMVNILQFL